MVGRPCRAKPIIRMGHSALAAAGSANAGKSEDKLLLARHRRCNLFTIPSPMPRQCWGARRRIIYGVIIAPADPLIPIIYEPPAAALFLVSILLSAIPGNPKCPRQCVRPGRQISTNDQQNVLVHALWLTPTEWPLVPSPKLDIRGWPKRNNLRGIGRNSISGRGSAQLHTRPHYLCSGENHQMDEKSPGRESGNEHCVDAPHSCDGMALAQSRAPLSARGIGTHSFHCALPVVGDGQANAILAGPCCCSSPHSRRSIRECKLACPFTTNPPVNEDNGHPMGGGEHLRALCCLAPFCPGNNAFWAFGCRFWG